jgi:outer membrane biosynthesis protein TonB
MSDDQTPEPVDTPETTQETPAAETKSGKKAKAEKKRNAALLQTDEEAPGPVEAEAPEPAETPAASAPADRTTAAPQASTGAAHDLFQQGVQALLRAEYGAADALFGQALTTYRKQNDRAGQIDTLEQLGHLSFLRGAEAQAQDYYRQASAMRAS